MFKCKECTMAFKTEEKLKSHWKTHLRHTAEKKENLRRFPCDVCQKKFYWKSLLETHMRVHTGEKPFQCKECGRGFNQKGNLDQHQHNVHEGVKNFVCDICGKGFSESGTLKNHRRIHTGQKPFKCHFCDQRFTTRCQCKVHEVGIHTKDYSHFCSMCGEGFAQSGVLKKHLKKKTCGKQGKESFSDGKGLDCDGPEIIY